MSGWLRAHLAVVYAFLYVPILVLVGLSYNASGLPTSWGWFSTVSANQQSSRSRRATSATASSMPPAA